MIHQLPTSAQITDGDHVQVRRITELPDQEIQVEVEYGTLDGGGNFQPRDMTPPQGVIIRDMQSFQQSSFSGNAPDTKGKPAEQFRQAAAQFTDDNALWPTSG